MLHLNTLFIPPLNTKLRLALPWTFTVYREWRNASLLALAKLEDVDVTMSHYLWKTGALGTYTFPVGTILAVERIYIRRTGSPGEFDSVTFRASGYTTDVSTGLKGSKEKTVRFWVKLADANTIVFDEVARP